MGIEQVGQRRSLIGAQRHLEPQELALYPVVAHQQDDDEALFIHRQQLEVPGEKGLAARGGGVNGIARQRADGLARLRHHPVQLLHLQRQRSVELLRLRHAELLALHQLVDVQPVALGGGDASGGGVGLLQIALLHQIRKLVADGGRADPPAHLGGDGLGANRLRGGDVILHHRL